MFSAACLHEPAASAPASPEDAARCVDDARIHTVEVVAGAVLTAGSLGFEWAAIESPNTSTHRVGLADTGAILGGSGLIAGIASVIEQQKYEDDGCGELTEAAIKRALARQRAQDMRVLDLAGVPVP